MANDKIFASGPWPDLYDSTLKEDLVAKAKRIHSIAELRLAPDGFWNTLDAL